MFKGQFLNGAHKQQRIPTLLLNFARIINEKPEMVFISGFRISGGEGELIVLRTRRFAPCLRCAQSNPVEASHPPSECCSNQKRKSPRWCSSRALELVAVREGFEPSIRYRIHTFQACSFGHSDTSPQFTFLDLMQKQVT